jgi:hypothetical protein
VVDEIEDIQKQRRALAAREAELFRRIELTGVFREDGHGSAKTMLRHVGKLSGRRRPVSSASPGSPAISN